MCYWDGSPLPSLATCSYRPSISAGLPDYIPYWHRSSVDSFSLVT